MRVQALRRGIPVFLATFLAVAAPGCSPLFKALVYTCDRVVDAADMLDLGISVTPRFSLSAYACLFGLGGLGGGTVNGYFAGLGGSRIGVFRHYHSNIGIVVYAYEQTGWGDFDLKDRDTLARRHRGPIAWLFIPGSDQCKGAG